MTRNLQPPTPASQVPGKHATQSASERACGAPTSGVPCPRHHRRAPGQTQPVRQHTRRTSDLSCGRSPGCGAEAAAVATTTLLRGRRWNGAVHGGTPRRRQRAGATTPWTRPLLQASRRDARRVAPPVSGSESSIAGRQQAFVAAVDSEAAEAYSTQCTRFSSQCGVSRCVSVCVRRRRGQWLEAGPSR